MKTPACRSRGRGRVVERAWLGREPTTRTGYHPGNVPPSRGGTCTTTGDLLRASSLRLLNGRSSGRSSTAVVVWKNRAFSSRRSSHSPKARITSSRLVTSPPTCPACPSIVLLLPPQLQAPGFGTPPWSPKTPEKARKRTAHPSSKVPPKGH